MENDLKKLILCLKWDIDNIEDLNTKRAYLSDRISDIQELVKNCNIADVVGRSEQLPCDCSKHATYFDEEKKPRCKNCNERSWLAR